jgi:cofilin
MASGIKVADACVEKFQELKLGKNHRYVLFCINADNTEIIVEKTAPKTATYQEFVQNLPKDDTRYAVFDFEYQQEGGLRNKILFVVWAPDSAKLKRKMLVASSKDAFRKKLVGIGTEIQATDLSEIDQAVVLDKVQR